jgi:hypothetical protein
MLCLQQCIDMCDLTPDEASALAGKVSLQEILAAQSNCPHRRAATDGEAEVGSHCELLPQIR